MVIIGGLGSILGSILGAAFIVLVPILLTNAPGAARHLPISGRPAPSTIEFMMFGGLIVLLS